MGWQELGEGAAGVSEVGRGGSHIRVYMTGYPLSQLSSESGQADTSFA